MFRPWDNYRTIMTSDNNNGRSFMQTVVIIGSLILLMLGIVLCIIGVINPSWQVADIKEFKEEHHVRDLGGILTLNNLLNLI